MEHEVSPGWIGKVKQSKDKESTNYFELPKHLHPLLKFLTGMRSGQAKAITGTLSATTTCSGCRDS